MEIFIGNIPYDTTADELERLLARHGRVDRVHLPVDAADRPRGFGFATMPEPAHAAAAIAALDGTDLNGRPLRVNEANGGKPGARAKTVATTPSRRTPPAFGRRTTAKSVRTHTRGALLVAAAFVPVLSASTSLDIISTWILGGYVVMSLVTYLVYAVDKDAARRGNWRVSETSLHLLSLAGGWPGAAVARDRLRHKTVKQPFRTVFAITILVNSAGFAWLFTADGAVAQDKLDSFIGVSASQFD